MSAQSIGRRSFFVMSVFASVIVLFSLFGVIGGTTQLSSSSHSAWSLGPLSCGCSVMSVTDTTMRIVPWVVLGVAAVILLWFAVSIVRVSFHVHREWQHRRAGKFPATERLSDIASRMGVQRVFCSRTEPDASTVGFWRPEIFVSDRLARKLPTGELMAVLAHEAAHQAQHDSARLFWVAVFEQIFGVLPAVKNLVAQFRQSIEHAADQASIAQLGGAFPLSRALTRLVGWRLEHSNAAVAGFAATPDRLEALLQPVQQRGQFFLPQLLAIVILPVLALVLFLRPASAAPAQQSSGVMCHAPAICRFITNSSPAAHQSRQPLNCAAQPSATCLNH